MLDNSCACVLCRYPAFFYVISRVVINSEMHCVNFTVFTSCCKLYALPETCLNYIYQKNQILWVIP